MTASRDIPDPSTLADRAIARLEVVERERDEARKVAEEREGDMHARIRAGYDRTIADAWRAKVAEVERERDEARATRDQANEDALALAYEAERARAERDDARTRLATLLDALGSSRDDVRIKAVAEAMETRRGWGL